MKSLLPLPPRFWLRCAVALLIIGVASALRAGFFAGLGRGTPYLTYYPAVMFAALFGGLGPGLLAAAVAGALAFFWVMQGYMSPVETLAILVFIGSSLLICLICEAMHRANARAQLAQLKAEASVQELQRETTERLRAAASLEISLQQLDGIISSLYAGIMAVSEAGIVEHVNQAFCDLFHLPDRPEALQGLPASEMLQRIQAAYAAPATTLARIQAVIAQGQALRGEEVAMRDGRCLLVDFIPLELAGRRCGHLWHHHDITDRKQAEEQSRQMLAEANASREVLLSLTEDQRAADAANERLLREAELSRRSLLSVIEDHRQTGKALAAEKQNLEALFASSPVAMFILDDSTKIVRVNTAAVALSALSSAEMLEHRPGHALHCVHSTEDPRGCGYAVACRVCATRQGIETLLATGGNLHGVELPFELSRHGTVQKVWIKIGAEPILLNGRRHLIVAMDDITELKTSEQRLRRLQNLLTETEEMGKVGGWEFDIATGHQLWTEEVYRIHELDRAFDPTVATGIQFYTPESRPVIERAVQRAIELGEPFDLELEIITALGNHRHVHAIGKADRAHGKVFGFFQDITARTRAEEGLKRQYALLNAVINSPGDIVIFSLDRNYCYTAFNEKHREEMRTVWRADIEIGSSLLESMTDPRLRELARQSIDRALGGEIISEVQHQPGPDIYYEFTWNPIRQKDGIIAGVAALIRDITARRHAEAKLAQQLDELRRWHAAMEGREGRVLELKREINLLLQQAGQPVRYPSVTEGEEGREQLAVSGDQLLATSDSAAANGEPRAGLEEGGPP